MVNKLVFLPKLPAEVIEMRLIKILVILVSVFAVGMYFPTTYGDPGVTGMIVNNPNRYFHRLKQMRAKDKDNPELSYQIANLYYSLQMEDEAIKEYRRTLKLSPDNFNAKWFLSKLLVSKGYLEEAFWLVREMITARSNNTQLYLMAGDILSKMDKTNAAKEYYDRYDELMYGEKVGKNNIHAKTAPNRGNWRKYFY